MDQQEDQNWETRLSFLGDTNSLSSAASGLGVLPRHSKTPVVTMTTMIPARENVKQNK